MFAYNLVFLVRSSFLGRTLGSIESKSSAAIIAWLLEFIKKGVISGCETVQRELVDEVEVR